MTAFNITKNKEIANVVKSIEKDANKQAAIYDLLYIAYTIGQSEKSVKIPNKLDLETIKQIDKIMPKSYVESDDLKSIFGDIDTLLIEFKKSESAIAKQIVLDKLKEIFKVVYFDGMINTLNIEGATAKDVVLEQLKLYNV